jgi:hypothetical protein
VDATKRAVRGLLGALTLVGGLTWILLNLHAPGPVTDMIVGAVLTAGGLVLLMPHRVPLPGLRTLIGAGGAALLGTLAGLLAANSHLVAMYAFIASRGWPFAWIARGAAADDPQTARALAEQSSWQIDAVNLAADLFFWAFVGLLMVAAANAIRRPAPQPAELRFGT